MFLAAVAAGTHPRRTDRRSHRPQAGDLGIDPRRAAVLAAAAARQPVLDRRARRSSIGLILVVRVLRDRGLRAGAGPGPRRADLGRVLRLRLRHGWHRRRGARPARRSDRHRRRLRRCVRSCRRSGCWRRSCRTSTTRSFAQTFIRFARSLIRSTKRGPREPPAVRRELRRGRS